MRSKRGRGLIRTKALAQAAKDLSKPKKEQAKALYMINTPFEKIQGITGIPSDVLRYLIKGLDGRGEVESCWERIREECTDQVVVAAMNSMLDSAKYNVAICNAIIKYGLEDLFKKVKDKEKTLSVRDLKDLGELYANIDKITRLELGDPTEIYQMAGLSPEEARRLLEEDPFAFGIVDATSRRIED